MLWRTPAGHLRCGFRTLAATLMARGVFISFEGSEGCGKSTQILRLAERLRQRGHRVLLTREPGGTEIGEQLRHLLQFSKAGHAMASETELLLFTASRAQLVRELLIPSLAEGTVVRSETSNSDAPTVATKIAVPTATAAPRMAFPLTVPPIPGPPTRCRRLS